KDCSFDRQPWKFVSYGALIEVAEVMGAQIATATTPQMVNGTYGAVGGRKRGVFWTIQWRIWDRIQVLQGHKKLDFIQLVLGIMENNPVQRKLLFFIPKEDVWRSRKGQLQKEAFRLFLILPVAAVSEMNSEGIGAHEGRGQLEVLLVTLAPIRWAQFSQVDKEPRWNRVRHRMEHLILQSCPEGVRASLHLDTQPSAVKVDEFFEHLLAELEGVSRVAEATSATNASTGRAEGTKGVRQVEAKTASSAMVDGSVLPNKDKGPKVSSPQGGDSPKKLCKWFTEGKGCRRGKDCRFLHDWSQIPKSEKGDRCMLCGGKGHRKDACTVVSSGAVAKREDGASSAKANRADASPKNKGGDPGLRKVISDATSVLKEAMSASATAAEAVPTQSGTGAIPQAGEGSEAPPMAVAAKIQAQLQDLEARVLDGGPRVRAVREDQFVEAWEPTALLDSGATHVVLDDAAAGNQDLVPCTVSLAGDQRQTWHQTPGGSLVAPITGDGHAPQTILPLGSLVSQLGCVLRWSQKTGLQLVHPKLGRLKTSLKGGCPQLSKDQALSLIRELESARLSELAGRLKKVQAHLKATSGLGFRDALDAFVESGSYASALALAQQTPFLETVPSRILSQLVVDLQDVSGWELLKAVPLNRRIRKRLHQSHSWLLHLGAGTLDPVLKQVCQEQRIEIVTINLAEGRLSGIVSDAPMRTWNGVRVGESHTVHLRTPDFPWGAPSNTEGYQSKVNDDVVFSLQPMWLWTVASIAQGCGIPFLQTHVLPQFDGIQPWLDSVVNPFSVWSNCSQFKVDGASDAGVRTRPMVVCSNLGFGDREERADSFSHDTSEACVSGWPMSFKREVTMALFGTLPQAQVPRQADMPQVSAVGAGVGGLRADARQSQEEHGAEAEVLSPLPEEAEDSSPSPPAARAQGEAPQLVPESIRPASKVINDKDRERWRRHIAAHHIPFRKDCLKCVMAGALGLQHRRVKCPSMYALAFDLAGPFKERGKDDKGGGYKYVLVAGLRVPDIALPGEGEPEPTTGGPRPKCAEVGHDQTVRADDEESEASWLNADLEPTPGVKHVSQHDSDSEQERESLVSWFEMPDLEDLPEPYDDDEPVQAKDDPEEVPDEGKAAELEGDIWDDELGVSEMSDEQFDGALSQMLFGGANKVLRFAVPVKSRKGPQILSALQEVVTECNRLGFPVKVAHTDRAKELMSKATMDWLQSKLIQPSFTQGDDPQANGLAERLVGWVKARARLHLAASGLGVEQWPAAMSFACAEHRNRMLQIDVQLPRFGQKVIFKSKHPTGRSKRPFLRWEHAVYLYPTPRTEGGHVLLRATSGAYLVAKNVRCVENLVDPEAELGDETVVEVDAPDDVPGAGPSDAMPMPSRRITGKWAVRAISLPAEMLAEDLRKNELFTSDHCGRLLELAFGGSDAVSKRTHRGPMELAVVLGAYGHGGLHGVTRASRVYPEVCRYLNEYLRRNLPSGQVNPQWTAVTVVVAPEVAVHKDVRNEPGSVNFVTQVARGQAKGSSTTELDEEEFEARFARWQRVLGGADEDSNLNPVSASIPHHLLMATVFQGRDWVRDPLVIANGPEGPVPAARVLDFSDDGSPDETQLPDRMLLFSVHDLVRDTFEMVILRVVLIEEEPGRQQDPTQPVLQVPGPPPPEIRAVSAVAQMKHPVEDRPCRLPVPLPNPTFIKVKSLREASPQEEALLCKAEAATTKGLEEILGSLTEPLSVTHTASQEEVRANLKKWRPAIEKELKSLKEPGVLISHFGKEARAMISGTGTTVIPLKGVFTTKAPGGPQDGLYRRKCRLVGCGNQASHIDADSLYAAGAPAELVRASLVQACRHQWSAFTCDIRSAFTQTPIPPYAARRYMLRPPRWLVELGLAEPDEYYSLGKVLYGFKEAPAWWSEHRDSKLLTAAFLGCRLEQGTSDPSLWRIMKGEELKGYLVTYVDDFLLLSDSVTARGLHQWLLEEAGWETDGLSEAKPGEPVRFLGMQLERHEDGHFSLNQESYIDELVRAYQLMSADKSKIACPKEVLMSEPESVPDSDEATVKAAQKVAGECLWLSQRTRFDISFTTAILCSRVSKDPSGALAIGRRLLCYLHQTKGFKLHLRPDPSAVPLRVFTDASFSPHGQHSYGGHIIELFGVPVVWRASRQGLIALSSAEAELIQAVEGCMFAESLLTVLEDLRVQCNTAQLLLDNTAAMAFIGGSGSQRTRHLKVRGHKIRQLIQSGWTIKHCPGEYQRADLLTKPLSAARMRFLRELLQLGEDETPEVLQEREDIPAVRATSAAPASCMSALLVLLQVCACKGDEAEPEEDRATMPIDWPWELAVLTFLVVLSTLFVWEASGAPCRRRQAPVPEIRAVTVKERRAKKLQDRVAAAIDSAVSESPTGDEGQSARRKGRNKCPPMPTEGRTPVSNLSPACRFVFLSREAFNAARAYRTC
ncbi:GIP, partial [Symbiodinium sp. KB8]